MRLIVPAGAGEQRELLARLRAVVEAKDAENAMLRAELEAQRERYRRLELRVAELERRLGSGQHELGDAAVEGPDRGEGAAQGRADEAAAVLGAGAAQGPQARRAARPSRARACRGTRTRTSGRSAPPPAECSRCGTGLAGAERAGTWWSQVWDVKITRFVTEYLLPLLTCPCCGKVNAAQAPPWAHPGSVSYGPGINTAAVLLSSYGNVPAERTANLIGMLLGVPVSPGFVDLASERLAARLEDAGFDEAMQAALAAEPALAADETPVNLLDPHAGLAEAGRRARRTCWSSAPRPAG